MIVGFEGQVTSGQHDRHAVVADGAGRRSPRRRRPLCAADRSRPGGIAPIPAVEMYIPSAAPWSTTLVSPVTIGDARRGGRLGHVGDDLAQGLDREAPPRGRTRPTGRAGRAPIMARSLTVPCTARWPAEPPGKRRGLTTNESVLNARRSPDGRVSTAASVWAARVSLAKAGRNTASSSAADALPPAPWARVTTSSSSRGRRRRKASIRSNTAASPRLSPPSGLPRCHPSHPPRPPACRPARHLVRRVPPGRPPGRHPSPRPAAPSVARSCRRSVTTGDPAPGGPAPVHSRAPARPGPPGCGGRCRSRTTRQWSTASLARHGAAVVAAQPDGQHAPPGRLLQGPQHVDRVAAGGEADRDVAGPGVGDDLAGEHQVEADVVGQRGEHGPVVDERDAPAAGGRDGGSTNSATVPSASVALPPLPKANSRPPRRNRSAIAVAALAATGRRTLRGVDVRSARLSANLAWADAARSATSRRRRRAPPLR